MLKKILIVDDDPTVMDLLLETLQDFSLSDASSGTEALQKCQTQQPDLLVLDVVLPDITGREVIKKIKKNPEIYGQPKIIVMTGMIDSLNDSETNTSAEEAAKSLWQKAYGIVDFVSKPFDLIKLRRTIETCLS